MTESYEYFQTGKNKDATPRFDPNARGLFIVFSREITEEDMLKVNLHAQDILKEESPEFLRAKTCWDNLPHTPERQLDNRMVIADPISEADEYVDAWVDQYADYPGVVYLYDFETRLNLVTGESEPRVPDVMEFSFGMGGMSMRPFDAATEKDCVEFRTVFAFAEKE